MNYICVITKGPAPFLWWLSSLHCVCVPYFFAWSPGEEHLVEPYTLSYIQTLYCSLPAITFCCKTIIPLPQSSLPKMLASVECSEESNWIEEIQTTVLMTTTVCLLHLWMGILNSGRVTLVELLTGGPREARVLGIWGKAMLVRLEKLEGVQSVHHVWLPEGRFLKFLWAS